MPIEPGSFDNPPHVLDIGSVSGEGYVISMLFWVVAALLTLGASLSVLLPLSRRRAEGAVQGEHDLEVYRDQLEELDRDARRGLIQPVEAEQARAEIGRRVLKAHKAAASDGAMRGDSRMTRSLGAIAVLAIPLISWGIYAVTGSPDLPSQPLSARLEKNPADATMDELIARAEAHLAANPDDPRGWDVLGPVYTRIGRFPEAVIAYRNAIRTAGASASREAGLGEALAGAAGGTVTDESQKALARALDLDPNEPRARFLLASALAQEGKIAEAVDAWRVMLSMLAPDSSWRGTVEQAISEGNRRLAADGGGPVAGPSQADIDAASDMSAEERNAMVESMVASLDARLRESPDDLEGWMRLVRAYVVMGRTQEANDAVRRGSQALGPDSAATSQLAEFSRNLGLSGDGVKQ